MQTKPHHNSVQQQCFQLAKIADLRSPTLDDDQALTSPTHSLPIITTGCRIADTAHFQAAYRARQDRAISNQIRSGKQT
jgi:hypothetical protein